MNEQFKPNINKPKSLGLDKKSFNQNAAKAFGKAVRSIRQKLKVSQENLAYISEIERAYMGKIERGEVNPSLGIILRISLALDIRSTEIMEEMENFLEQ